MWVCEERVSLGFTLHWMKYYLGSLTIKVRGLPPQIQGGQRGREVVCAVAVSLHSFGNQTFSCIPCYLKVSTQAYGQPVGSDTLSMGG